MLVKINYTNWKGETADRNIVPINLFCGTTEFHTNKQWLLKAFDADKRVCRTFAMSDIHSWGPSTAYSDNVKPDSWKITEHESGSIDLWFKPVKAIDYIRIEFTKSEAFSNAIEEQTWLDKTN